MGQNLPEEVCEVAANEITIRMRLGDLLLVYFLTNESFVYIDF